MQSVLLKPPFESVSVRERWDVGGGGKTPKIWSGAQSSHKKVGNREAVPNNRAENHSCVVKPEDYQPSVVTPVNVKCLACWLDGI